MENLFILNRNWAIKLLLIITSNIGSAIENRQIARHLNFYRRDDKIGKFIIFGKCF